MQVNFNVLNQQGVPALFEANDLPNPGFTGRLFFSTSGEGIFFDTGANWMQVASLGGGMPFIPTLDEVTSMGNFTTNKIELANTNTTTDSLSIYLNSENGGSNQAINIFDNGFPDYNTQGIVINLTGNSEGETNFGIFVNVINGTGIYANAGAGIGAYISSNDEIGAYIRGVNTFPLAIDCTSNDEFHPPIKFVNTYTYTGAAVAALEYLPIEINGSMHYIRLFAAI
jgi:hypothetical protein